MLFQTKIGEEEEEEEEKVVTQTKPAIENLGIRNKN
jgi:hypothetical protein